MVCRASSARTAARLRAAFGDQLVSVFARDLRVQVAFCGAILLADRDLRQGMKVFRQQFQNFWT
ncbi:MAG: hypothetical protein ABJB47_10575, partial [Actinomycetota bacterium]